MWDLHWPNTCCRFALLSENKHPTPMYFQSSYCCWGMRIRRFVWTYLRDLRIWTLWLGLRSCRHHWFQVWKSLPKRRIGALKYQLLNSSRCLPANWARHSLMRSSTLSARRGSRIASTLWERPHSLTTNIYMVFLANSGSWNTFGPS